MAQQLTHDILNAALEHLTSKRQQIDEQIAEVRRLLGNGSAATSTSDQTTRKRTMSAAGRQAIAEAQRRRWAAKKAESGATAAPKPAKAKRRLSAEGRRNIVAALNRRWAAKRAATGKAAAAKKAPVKTAKAKAPAAAVAGSSSV